MLIRPRSAPVAVCALVLAAACGGDPSGPPAVATVDVAGPATDVIVGQTAQLTATAKDAKGNAIPNLTTTWSTSSSAIATVSTNGLVTGVSAGSVTVTATINTKTGTRTLNVIPAPVATVSVLAQTAAIQTGTTTQLAAELRDANNNVLSGRSVSWSTSDAAIASVSNDGLVTGLAAGTVMITARSEGKSGSAQIVVTSGNPADAPQITAVSPNPLVQGQPATITGSKFAGSAGANVVRVGGVPAVVTAATTTSLQIVVPNLNCKPTGPVNVDVTVAGLTSVPKAQPFDAGATFSLAQGQQRLFTNPAEFCLVFGASSANEAYLIGVQSVSPTGAGLTSVKVTGESPAGSSVVNAVLPWNGVRSLASAARSGLTRSLGGARSERMARHRVAESQILEQERATLLPRLRSLNTAARASMNASAQRAAPTIPATAKVGDVFTVRVPTRGDPTCQLFTPVTATVKSVGTNSIILEDNANPPGGFSATDYAGLTTQFDTQIYTTDVAYFGAPTDFDDNSRVAILITKEVNKMQNVLGVVFSVNFFAQSQCPASNEGEFFYGRAPDPNGTVGGKYAVADALDDAPLTIAHEFAHVIQFGRRLEFTAPNYVLQSTWELEGQATFAEEVNGYTATGLGPGRNLGPAELFNDPELAPDEWFLDAFTGLVVYYGFQSQTSKAPNAPEQCSWLSLQSQGNDGPCVQDLPVYGASWSFLRWLSDQYGPAFPGGEKGLHQKLIDNSFSGFATITNVIGAPIDVLLSQWAAALYTDDRVGGLDPKLTFTSWNMAAVEDGVVETAHLTPRGRAFGTFSDEVAVRGGSTAYFTVSGNGRPATGIRARDLADGPLPSAMRMWVVRLR